ncbi:MAG: alpha-galactosidase [Erythrobacter sp.]
MSGFLSIVGGGAQIVLQAESGERGSILYAGPELAGMQAAELAQLSKREHAPGGPEVPIAASWLNPIGAGHPSPPGVIAHRSRQSWAFDPRVTKAVQTGAGHCVIHTRDEVCEISLTHTISINDVCGTASFTSAITNDGDGYLCVDWCSALCLPLDPRLQRLTSFSGKWAGEFQTEQVDLIRGSFVRENRAGRTSHASYPGLYLGAATTGEEEGPAAAFHLAWNGNHRLQVDCLPDGDLALQAGELLLPGEIVLERGETYSTPALIACWSAHGFGDLTKRLHGHVRQMMPPHRKPRPVHFNTWEAVYFDHSAQKIMALADQAAAIGAERFVLDDGWFGSRRDERSGLGDWHVSSDIYPDGLAPIADYVRSLGMEFGLWFEPEMVNPDSDLYRSHPDWVLKAEGAQPIASRHQLPLDLTQPAVSHHLFERISALVSELGISYIKWDMNRDIQHPGGLNGHSMAHQLAQAVRDLMARILAAHAGLEIESCSSGGARADYAMLAHTARIWTSDNNDARARYPIMRGAGYFLPLSVLGNHVGPRKCHITERELNMEFRAGTAIFGHMGLELDLAQESEEDRSTLSRAIILHKQHRELIHDGRLFRLDTAPHISAMQIVSNDHGQALVQVGVLDSHPNTHPPRLFLAGLAPDRRYEMACVWPQPYQSAPRDFAGSSLMDYGMQLPRTPPDTCLIYHLKATN